VRATTVKRGFGIGFLKISGEKLSSQPELVDPFKLELKNKIQELNLTLDQLYNADETGLYWKLLPDRTFVSLTEKTGMGRFDAAVSPRPIRRQPFPHGDVSPPFESHHSCHDRFNIYRVCNPHF
jgi:hypothetical protein